MLPSKRRLKALTITILFTLISMSMHLGFAPNVLADERLSDLRVLFSQRRYVEVMARLKDYREQPYGKLFEVDYMIASCSCQSGDLASARRRFQWIIKNYPLGSMQRRRVENDLRQCSARGLASPPSFRQPTITSRRSDHTGVSGKGGTLTEANTITTIAGTMLPVTSESAELIREIAPEEFESRLFDLSQRAQAIESVKKLAGPNYKVESAGPFILANNKFPSPEPVLRIARELQRYASFYNAHFRMPSPYKFITIYLVAETGEMQRLAARLHGIQVSKSSIGYSFPLDLSMVGIIYDTEFGTLAHELFHLMVRNDFGDIPPWLDEGMASLYEVSETRGEYIAGVSNWRGRILAELWPERPPVEQLIRMDWRLFDGAEERQDFRRQAINHATARYFMLYLQEKGKLVDVYRAFRGQSVDDLTEDPGQEAVRPLALVLQKPMATVDKDFESWFLNRKEAGLKPLNPNRHPTRDTAPNAPAPVNAKP